MKTGSVEHRSLILSPGIAACDVYAPAGKPVTPETEKLLIIPGLGSVKTDYARFATELAAQDYQVISPDCNNGGDSSALQNRAEVVLEIMQTLDEPIRLLPHSIGAPVTALAMKDANMNNVVSINFLQPAAFTDHGPADIVSLTQFYFTEFLPRAHRLLPDVMRHNKHHGQRFDFAKRIAETWGLFKLDSDFMVNAVRDLYKQEVEMSFLVSPKDRLTPANAIRQAVEPIVGSNRVRDVHPNAGHLAAQTHPRRMARLVIEQFNTISAPDNYELGAAA
jgi:pimeloyl-ACP methyl ester carboxylesterase